MPIKDPKEKTNQIDDIFSTLKNKKKNTGDAQGEANKSKTERKEKLSKRPIEKKEKKGPKYTEEGYKVYSVEELNIGKGGGTALCPFDCDCCF